MWQKHGKGIKYKGHYMRDANGDRIMVLVGFKKNGEVHTVTSESWQMLIRAGWKHR
jgi:hypothetical protein